VAVARAIRVPSPARDVFCSHGKHRMRSESLVWRGEEREHRENTHSSDTF